MKINIVVKERDLEQRIMEYLKESDDSNRLKLASSESLSSSLVGFADVLILSNDIHQGLIATDAVAMNQIMHTSWVVVVLHEHERLTMNVSTYLAHAWIFADCNLQYIGRLVRMLEHEYTAFPDQILDKLIAQKTSLRTDYW